MTPKACAARQEETITAPKSFMIVLIVFSRKNVKQMGGSAGLMFGFCVVDTKDSKNVRGFKEELSIQRYSQLTNSGSGRQSAHGTSAKLGR